MYDVANCVSRSCCMELDAVAVERQAYCLKWSAILGAHNVKLFTSDSLTILVNVSRHD